MNWKKPEEKPSRQEKLMFILKRTDGKQCLFLGAYHKFLETKICEPSEAYLRDCSFCGDENPECEFCPFDFVGGTDTTVGTAYLKDGWYSHCGNEECKFETIDETETPIIAWCYVSEFLEGQKYDIEKGG